LLCKAQGQCRLAARGRPGDESDRRLGFRSHGDCDADSSRTAR
jgi:hypothetical protein